ncbi:EthD domain-containing protein [Streptomyces sp. NPDC056468]|uniref:EthD domain-containing protein n=1 Tax=Streptomyces sp. NPDC056468 TaxID=3345830 RepID=UPI003686AC38
MIKVSIYLVRRPGMSPGEFVDHWKNQHGPLVLSLPEFTSRVRRYTQQLVLRDLPAEVPVLPYDGVAELWVDKPEDIFELLQSPVYEQKMIPDEEKFLDRSKTVMLLTTEHNVID